MNTKEEDEKQKSEFESNLEEAEQGNALTQYMIGYEYRYGEGVEQDHEEAMQWFRYAADQGNALAQKIIEESGEVALAGNNQDKNETIQEMADLLYHLMVFLKALDIPLNEVWKELGNRMEQK